MIKTGKRPMLRRVFSESLKKEAVRDFESGKKTIRELSQSYSVSVAAVYKWVYKYSNFEKQSIQIVEMKDSEQHKIKELEKQVKELEQAVGRKQINIDYLEKMIDLAKEHYDIDIKKNSDTPHSGGFKTTDKQ